jgi:hypothetical protein
MLYPISQGGGFNKRLCFFLCHGGIPIFDAEKLTHRGEEISIVYMSPKTEFF